MIRFLQTYIPIGGGNPSLDQVLAIGDRPYKEILTQDDYDAHHNFYEYNLVAGDTTKALNVGNNGIHVASSSKINLNENFPDNAECIIYGGRIITIAASEDNTQIINSNNEFGSYDTQANQILISIKRFGVNFIVNEIDSPLNYLPENNANKVEYSQINPEDIGTNSIYYPSVNGLVDYTGNLVTSLKPIIINDPYQEGFTDLDSALTFISNYSIYTPDYIFYSIASRRLYIWYPIQDISTIWVTTNLNTGDGFAKNTFINIQDESGFIFGFDGDAFRDNSFDSGYSIDTILGCQNLTFPNDDALTFANSNYQFKGLNSYGNNFGHGFSGGKLEIETAYFAGSDVLTDARNATIKIKQLLASGATFITNSLNTRIDIQRIDPSVSFDVDSFTTGNPISLHIPAIDVSLTSINYTQLQANITNPDSVIIRD